MAFFGSKKKEELKEAAPPAWRPAQPAPTIMTVQPPQQPPLATAAMMPPMTPQLPVRQPQPQPQLPPAPPTEPAPSHEQLPLFVKVDRYDEVIAEVTGTKASIEKASKLIGFLHNLSDLCDEGAELLKDVVQDLDDSQSKLEGIFVKIEDVESFLAEEKEKHKKMEDELKHKEEENVSEKGSAKELAEDIDLKISELREKLKPETVEGQQK